MWKKKEEATDSWLDNVDWGKVKERSEAEKTKREEEDEAEDEAEAAYDEVDNYRKIVKLVRPKESIAKALRRLGENEACTCFETCVLEIDFSSRWG